MAADHSTVSATQRGRLGRYLCLWSILWLKIGLFAWALLLSLLQRRFPEFVRLVGYVGGVLTIMAMFYLMHYLLVSSCGRTVKRLCFPLLVLIDGLTIGGALALFLSRGD